MKTDALRLRKNLWNVALCATLVPVMPALAQAPHLAQESFDALQETVLNGQNGWKSNARVTVQTEHNAQGGGKALRIEAPDGSASRTVHATGLSGVVAVDFKVLLDPKTVTPSAKLLVSLHDSDRKRVTLFFHSEANQWGVKSGANYPHVQRKGEPGKWQSVRLVLDFTAKTVSVYVAEGARWNTVFSRQKFDDTAAANLSSIEFVRNGQGNSAPVFVDELTVAKVEADQPPVVETSVLSADTPAKPRFGVFAPGETVEVRLAARRKAGAVPDQLHWKLLDWNGAEVRSGAQAVTGENWEHTLPLPGLAPGYYALEAGLKTQGDRLPARGSRPEGILTFGVLPDIKGSHQVAQQSRFGIWGTNFIKENEWLKGDPYSPLVTTLGATWTGSPRQWFQLEPNRAGEWQPRTDEKMGEFNFALQHKMPYTVLLEGIPAWNLAVPAGVTLPTGKLSHVQAMAYPPKDWDAYANFLTRVAREQAALRKKFGYLQQTHYLIHHEPDWHWKGTDQEFIRMYEVAHKALHAGDEGAVLLGPRYGVLKNGLAHLERLFPLGLGKHLDGLAFHTYYLPPRISNSPEAAGTPDMIKRHRELAERYMGKNPLLAQLEWGVRYELSYEGQTPALLKRHAAQTARGHLIALGEGARYSYLFYTADYSGEPGYGLTFNLTMPNPEFGALEVSPKPTYMAASTLSRLLAGTQTVGRTEGPSVLGYLFSRSDGQGMLQALWSRDGSPRRVTLQGEAKGVEIMDLMGRRVSLAADKTLTLDEAPLFLLSPARVEWKEG